MLSNLTLRCKEHGLLSLRCKHEEIAYPFLGKVIMCIGAFECFVGVYYFVAR